MLFVLNARQSFRKDNIKYDTSMGGTPTIGGSGRSQPAVKVDTDVVARYDLDLESNNLGRDGYAVGASFITCLLVDANAMRRIAKISQCTACRGREVVPYDRPSMGGLYYRDRIRWL